MGKAHIEYLPVPTTGERFWIPCECDIGENHDFKPDLAGMNRASTARTAPTCPHASGGPAIDRPVIDGSVADCPVTNGPVTNGAATHGAATHGSATHGPVIAGSAPGCPVSNDSAPDCPVSNGSVTDTDTRGQARQAQ